MEKEEPGQLPLHMRARERNREGGRGSVEIGVGEKGARGGRGIGAAGGHLYIACLSLTEDEESCREGSRLAHYSLILALRPWCSSLTRHVSFLSAPCRIAGSVPAFHAPSLPAPLPTRLPLLPSLHTCTHSEL